MHQQYSERQALSPLGFTVSTMTLLRRFLKLLEWMESTQDFFYFLSQPAGLSVVAALLLYFPIQLLGCDRLSATTLSCTVALTLFCSLERPKF